MTKFTTRLSRDRLCDEINEFVQRFDDDKLKSLTDALLASDDRFLNSDAATRFTKRLSNIGLRGGIHEFVPGLEDDKLDSLTDAIIAPDDGFLDSDAAVNKLRGPGRERIKNSGVDRFGNKLVDPDEPEF
ncbi:MAG: hypothetical protein LBO05_03260 [Deltaproteobacteria bacterium]|jgi:hypothetical protein|nr:hypothetical protein [Deltaproteobacteria bacterium]